ncbi:EboA domain-containing protein [Pseudomonas tohonis]|uniref:EboA domain-containing protein n=1 Tax=Pseudomonas tohonis TaxID=2725477 RepID=UPI001F3B69A9|nr:EboA domain-containing protein [Pseudomonas tohonis]
MNSPTTLQLGSDRIADLHQALRDELTGAALAWWNQARERLAAQPDIQALMRLSGPCRRQIGDALVADLPWTRAALARALLLAQALEADAGPGRATLLQRYFEWGDDQEKAAALRALDWLDGQGASLELALFAGRTNSCEVFAALALDNPYPARHYPERAFHLLMLKGVGMDLDLRRVLGLAPRRSRELNQLALDMLEERLAADRPAPPGISHLLTWPLLAPDQLQRLDAHHRQGRLPSGWLPGDLPLQHR